jgi:hypothetical protein
MDGSTVLSFTTSNRGKRLLIHSSYIYRLKKSTVTVKHWACNSVGCVATVHTNQNDEFLKANGQHYHMPSPEQIELRNLRQKVKERVQVGTNSVPKIYEEELVRSNLSSTALVLAPVALEASKFFILCNL